MTEPAETTTPATLPGTDDGAEPKRGRGRPKGSSSAQRTPGRPSNAQKFEDRLTEFFTDIAGGVTMMGLAAGNPTFITDGQIIGESIPALVDSWSRLAEENPRVKAALERMMTGSAWTAVMISTGSVVRAIVENHATAAAARKAEREAAAEAAEAAEAEKVTTVAA